MLQASVIKYQLPGSTNTYVDLIDDEDVRLMFDEWADHLAAEGKAARTLKLHVYIDWQAGHKRGNDNMPSGGPAVEQRQLDTISEAASEASIDTPVARAPPPPTGDMDAQNSRGSPHGQSSRSHTFTILRAAHLTLYQLTWAVRCLAVVLCKLCLAACCTCRVATNPIIAYFLVGCVQSTL